MSLDIDKQSEILIQVSPKKLKPDHQNKNKIKLPAQILIQEAAPFTAIVSSPSELLNHYLTTESDVFTK